MDEPDAPDPRNLLNEGRETLAALRELSPEMLELYKKYGSQFAGEAANSFNTAYDPISSNIGNAENANNSALRKSMLGDLLDYGQDTVEAIRAMNPQQAALADALSNRALEDLGNAGELSARDKYDTAQLARSAGEARGNIAGNSTVYNELLNAENLKETRKNNAANLAATASGLQQSFTTPALNAIGQTSSATNLAVSPALTSSSYINPATYNPYANAYAQDLYNTNYNAAWDRYYKEGNKWENLIGGTLGLGGTIAGGFFGGEGGAKLGGTTGMAMGSSIGSLF